MSEAERPLIVAGTEGSDDSLRAVEFAARWALRRGGRLRIINAYDDPVLASAWGVVFDTHELQDVGEEAIARAREVALGLGLPEDRLESAVMPGAPASALTRQSPDAQLVVVGRRSVPGLERIFVGSTSVAVAASARCPVVMISAATNPEATGERRRVVACVDASDKSVPTLTFAFDEAHARGARLLVQHVVAAASVGWVRTAAVDAHRIESFVQTARDAVTGLLAPLRARYPEVPVDVDVRVGNPLDVAVERSDEADLLVLGSHVPNLPSFGLSGIVRGAMAHAHCPVVIVPAGRK